jgi:hypothetical protein
VNGADREARAVATLLSFLPKRFVRIRHYGILANRFKKKNIAVCRTLMGLNPELPQVQMQMGSPPKVPAIIVKRGQKWGSFRP